MRASGTLTVAHPDKNGHRPVNAASLKSAILDAGKKTTVAKPLAAVKKAAKLSEKSFLEIAVSKLDKEQLNGLWSTYNY